MSKRNYIDEILEKKGRTHIRGSRLDIFSKRIHPLVKGFREIKSLSNTVSWRNEWLKYSAIGYIACVEGYFRLLIADLINSGNPYISRISDLREIKFSADTVVAIHEKKITLGEFVAHLLPLNGVSDINCHLSALFGTDYITYYLKQPLSEHNTNSIGEVFPEEIGMLENLFQLRHLYAHELATKEKVPVRKIEKLVGAAAIFVTLTDEIISKQYFENT